MSDSNGRSTESEDGEIEREESYVSKRSRRERGHGYRPEYETKRRRREKTESPDLRSVSPHSEGEQEYEDMDQVEADDSFDENSEEGLDIKPPQHKGNPSRHKNYHMNASNYYRNTTEKASKDSNRTTNEDQFRQREDRYRDRHRRERNRYSDTRSTRNADDMRHRRRSEVKGPEMSANRGRAGDKEKPSDRWMVLEDKNYPNENWKTKSSEQTSSRTHKERHNRDGMSGREKWRKTSPKEEKKVSKTVDSSVVSGSSASTTQTTKPLVKKMNAMIEVQEVEMSEEELLSDSHNTEGTDSKTSEKMSDRSDVSELDEEEREEEDNEKEVQEVVIEAKESDDSDLKRPRIVIDREVVYYPQSYPQSNADMSCAKMSDDFEDAKDDSTTHLPDYYPAIQGCRSVEEFQCINRIEEGTYGVVYRARDKRTNETVALKRLKMEKEKEGFPITSLREISTLLKAQHENIVTVREIVVGSNMDKIYIVMEFVEHDLKSLMETMKQPFLLGEVKTLMMQLLRAVAHLHDNWILHRDLKTSNLLLSHRGILKVGDFGLAREYGSPLKAYTPVVVTLWYRAPELLLQAKQYSYPIDIWSVGCIFGELLTMKPLFPGKSEIDQLNAVFKDLGTPTDKIWPEYSELPLVKKVAFSDHPYNNLHNRLGQKLTKSGFDLLNRFLTYCPSRRITADEALKHEFFTESPLPVDPSMFPTWPAKSELGVSHARKAQSPKPPSGGKQFAKQLAGDDDEKLIVESQGFHMSLPVQGKASKGGGFNLKF